MSEPIAVLGLGGVGGMLAARTGALCVGTERTVDAVKEKGLALVRDGVTTVARLDATARLARPVSLLVVAVKAYDLEQALERIAPEAIAGAVVLPLLNGLEHLEALRERLDARAVAAGSIGRLEAFSPEPGLVVQRTPDATVTVAVAELDRQELDAVLAPLRVEGLELVVASDERSVLWEKAARLAVLAAATVASAQTIGELRDDPVWRKRLAAALDETVRVAGADGVGLRAVEQWAIVDAMPHDLTTSTARDAAAGSETELEAITGSVVRAGVRLGIPTPVLAELHEEAGRRVPSR